MVDRQRAIVDLPAQRIGDDAAGATILAHCQELDINVEALRATKMAPTSYTLVVTVKKSGRRTFFHQRGANALLGSKHFDFQKSNAKIFHLGYLLLLDGLDMPHQEGTVSSYVLKRAQEAGMMTSLDVVSEDSNRFESLVVPALAHCDVSFMNEFEASRTTGIPLRVDGELKWGALEPAARQLITHGVKMWAVIHFPEGAFALSSKGHRHIHGSLRMPTSRIKGVVGAGDAFAAGVLYGLHEKMDMDRCLRYGVCAAATSLNDRTTSEGVQPISECLALGEKHGFRETPIT